ncbi:MAG: LLM class flavin-dependent oxidoreductase [Dehalococcoidia bacterium]|nr:LLM class flavin-dependent oxidoreductase [Dehalococcoidia bacterium]
MFIGHFNEQPWQDPKLDFTKPGAGIRDLGLSNAVYSPEIGQQLYNRYIDEKLYAEEIGMDGLMLNEHHSMPGCMQGVTNVEAAILARQTKKAKIAILGNVLPIWDDPLWLAEQLAMIDMISHGRLITGWVRGTGRESITHNAVPPYNRERFQESHDFVIKAWTTPGPFRWEGKHYQYRYVNPWSMPLQKPHSPIWIPCSVSRDTAVWCARYHYPMIMLASGMEATKEMFQVYHDTAAEEGYTSGPQNVGYLFKVHVDETDEQGYEVGRKFIEGVSNPFNVGNEGSVLSFLQALPGLSSRAAVNTRIQRLQPAGRGGSGLFAKYDDQIKNYTIISGTPKTVLPKVRHVLEYLRPGSIFFWDGDGAMTHDDQVRSLRLMGEELIPATREIGKELGLLTSFETNDGTGYDQTAWAAMKK